MNQVQASLQVVQFSQYIGFIQYLREMAFTGREAVGRFGGIPMQISMEFLWHFGDDVQQSLRRDGWAIAEKGNAEIEVSHPQVASEGAARIRLYHLGLLTSGAVRIEFRPSCQTAPERERRKE